MSSSSPAAELDDRGESEFTSRGGQRAHIGKTWQDGDMAIDLVQTLSGKWEDGTRPKDLYAAHVARRPEAFVAAILEGLGAKEKRVQAGCAELASLLSAERPELLAAELGVFLANLDARQPILRWEAACTVGNLASPRTRRQLRPHLEKLFALLGHQSIVLQGHAARALGKIARADPELAPKILEALFAHADRFPGTRVGYLIEAAEQIAELPALAEAIRAHVTPYATSTLRPVQTKARRVLKRLGGTR